MLRTILIFQMISLSMSVQAIDNNTFIHSSQYVPPSPPPVTRDARSIPAPRLSRRVIEGARTVVNPTARAAVAKPVIVPQESAVETAQGSDLPYWDPSQRSEDRSRPDTTTAPVVAAPELEPAPTPEPPVVEQASVAEADTSGEVVSGGEASPEVATSPLAPETSLRPQARPSTLRTEAAPPSPAAGSTTRPDTFDMTNCAYRRGSGDCWSGKGLSQRIEKVVQNVAEVNRLHGANLDPRYMLCTGWKESHFNPGALGAAGEKGMFQIMNSTGRAALRLGPRVLPASDFMTRMVNSSLAQTELSFLVLKMKVNEGASARTLSGNASVQDYWGLARRYNGAGPAAERYANKVTDCLRCLREAFPTITGAVNESRARTCLRKAQ